MDDFKVCRICLAMDVKMQDLRMFPWNIYFEPTFNPFANTGPHPMDVPYACYECAVLLKKNYYFREKSHLSQSLLHNIFEANGMLTRELVEEVNRKDMNLESKLGPHLITENSFINVSYSEPNVKDEPKETDDEKVFNGSIDTKILFEDAVYDDLPLGGLSTDEDEPLSLHKRNKEKKVKVKKKNKRVKKRTEENTVDEVKEEPKHLLTLEVTFEEMLSQTDDPPRVKNKRGRPRKTQIKAEASASGTKPHRRTKNTGGVVDDDDADLEEYCTIIKLTDQEQLEEITKRQTSSNYLNASFQCNLCFKGFIDTHAWRHHVGKHDPSAGDVECPICKFRFKTKRALQKHAANHEKKYACKSCPYVSKTTTQAKQHQRWHKGVTYKCQYCDEVSTKWTSYLSHVRIKHPSEFICGICGYSFVSTLGLTMHKTMMHKDVAESETSSNQEGPYCEECDVKFISLEAYKRHMVTSAKHMQNEDFKTGCRVCGESFKSGEELRLHHRREHARKRPKNYGKKPPIQSWPAQCEHCPETILNARDYWTHFRRAHPDKSYPIQKNHVCDICGKSFRGNAFLVYHKRTHSSERNFKCARCPKAFFNRTNLQMHEKTHSDHRPYACTICFKGFKCKGALDRHFRSHTGEKPYECEVCGKAFGQSNSRKLHVRTVHLKLPAPYVSRARQERKKNHNIDMASLVKVDCSELIAL